MSGDRESAIAAVKAYLVSTWRAPVDSPIIRSVATEGSHHLPVNVLEDLDVDVIGVRDGRPEVAPIGYLCRDETPIQSVSKRDLRNICGKEAS